MNICCRRNSTLEKLIISGCYHEAMDYVSDLSKEEYYSYLSCFAYEEQNLSAYSFACFMYERTLSEDWCRLIVTLSEADLNCIDGMNCVNVFYTRELVKLNRTTEYLSWLLQSHYCPDTRYLITFSEKKMIAEEILKYDSSEKFANEYMQDYHNGHFDDVSIENEDFGIYLEMGLYEKALKLIESDNNADINSFCVNHAQKEQSIEIYNFVQYMVNKTKSVQWIRTAIDVLTNGLESLKEYGVLDIAAYYSRELVNICKEQNSTGEITP